MGTHTGGGGGGGHINAGTITRVRFEKMAQWLKIDGHALSIKVHYPQPRLMSDPSRAVTIQRQQPIRTRAQLPAALCARAYGHFGEVQTSPKWITITLQAPLAIHRRLS